MATIGLVALVLVARSLAFAETAQTADWPSFGNGPRNTKYSPLDQIDASNFDRLAVAWTWEAIDGRIESPPVHLRPGPFKPVPVVVGGRMYISTAAGQVAALDAATGELLWSYDPKSYIAGRPANLGFQHRGVAYWQREDFAGPAPLPGERPRREQRRVLMATHDRRLLSLDAMTGEPDPGFGVGGFVAMTPDLGRPIDESRTTHSSPPAICRGRVIVGSIVSDGATRQEAPPGHVRAYDVESGALRWVFHTIPQAGEEGNATWENESWRYTGNTNVWSMIAVDEELGLAYLPIGTPTSDLYGGHRLGDNLFAESLVAVDCLTGVKRWHFQLVHHGLWDYDLPSAPNLIDLTVEGKPVKALAQVTKQAFLLVLDRETGKPLWPIEERPVPPSEVPGDRASPTQPFPTRPAPYDRQGITVDDLIDFTPELRAEALAIASGYELGALYTPPRLQGAGKPLIQLPSDGGGTNWTGAAVDPESGIVYVPSYTRPVSVTLTTPDPSRSDLRYVPQRWYEGVAGPRGLPLVKPPYGRITAIDLATGEHLWVTPHGEGPRHHPDLEPIALGRLGAAHHEAAPLVTRTLLFVTQRAESTRGDQAPLPDRPGEISVYDKASGAYLGGIPLPSTPNSNPVTYQVAGKQYLAVSVGGGRYAGGGGGTPPLIVALALP